MRGLAASLAVPSRKRLERLEKIQALTDAALAHVELDDLLQELLGRIKDLLGADTAAILLLDDDGRMLAARSVMGLEEEVENGFRVPVGTGFAGRVAAERRPIVVDDIDGADIVNPLLRDGTQSLVGAPLIVHGRMTGVVHIGSAEPHHFDSEDVELLQLAAERAALVIDHARLFEREREAREEAERRAQAARVLTYVADGIFVVDDDGVVRFWNPAAETITGRRSEEVLGRPATEILPGWHEAGPRVPVARSPGADARPGAVSVEVGGRELWLSVTGVRFDDGIVYAFRDLTEERRIEEVKRDFVATVSHELRTPLAAVYGAAMTIRRQGLKLGKPGRETLLGIIEREAERLARFVDEILLASRIDTGTVRVALDRCDGAEMARSVVEAAKAHSPTTVAIELTTPSDLPPVAADADKVRQVLGNLIENAVKYGEAGELVEVFLERQNGSVRFCVRDHGPGIPPEEQGRIFEKFYRMGEAAGGHTSGTGLGLYICQELVRLMNGSISVTSDEAEGTTFFFELPLAD